MVLNNSTQRLILVPLHLPPLSYSLLFFRCSCCLHVCKSLFVLQYFVFFVAFLSISLEFSHFFSPPSSHVPTLSHRSYGKTKEVKRWMSPLQKCILSSELDIKRRRRRIVKHYKNSEYVECTKGCI